MTGADFVFVMWAFWGAVLVIVCAFMAYVEDAPRWRILAAFVWPLWFAVALAYWVVRALPTLPFTEEGRLDRRMRIVRRDAGLLTKRIKAEAMEEEYRALLEKALDR